MATSKQHANLPKIHDTYCHKIIVPFYLKILQRLMLLKEINNDSDSILQYKVPSLGQIAQQCFENDPGADRISSHHAYANTDKRL